MSEKARVTTTDLMAGLRTRFCPPAWAFLPQVRNGTGFERAARTADAVAMGLFPSRGLELHGFEVKAHREDWLRELKMPQKAEEIAQFCESWWIVAPKEVVRPDEVPGHWGLLVPRGTTMMVAKQAKPQKATPIDKLFLAAILRRAQQVITPEAELRAHYEKGKFAGAQETDQYFQHERTQHGELKKAVAEFEKTSGVHIGTWSAGNIGDAVRMVLNGEHLHVQPQLRHMLERLQELQKNVEKELSEMEQKEPVMHA